MFTVHLAGVGTTYEQVVGEDGRPLWRARRVTEHPTDTFCGLKVSDAGEAHYCIADLQSERTCAACLKALSTSKRSTAHVQPLFFR